MRKLKLDELGRKSEVEYAETTKAPLRIVLDQIRSGLNVGSFFRSADAFQIEHIDLCGITPQPPHREILKTAIGADRTVQWSYHRDIAAHLTVLKSEGYHIIGIEQTDESIRLSEYQIEPDLKYALVFGNEVEGLSESALPLIDAAIEIRQWGTKHSLNVSVCAGIVMWHFAQKMKASTNVK